MTHKKYNGWTNYETWAVSLWINNDYWTERAGSIYGDAEPTEVLTKTESAKYALSDAMKSEFEEGKDELLDKAKQTCSVWADLLGAALSEVNWDEIAGHYIDAAESREVLEVMAE